MSCTQVVGVLVCKRTSLGREPWLESARRWRTRKGSGLSMLLVSFIEAHQPYYDPKTTAVVQNTEATCCYGG